MDDGDGDGDDDDDDDGLDGTTSVHDGEDGLVLGHATQTTLLLRCLLFVLDFVLVAATDAYRNDESMKILCPLLLL